MGGREGTMKTLAAKDAKNGFGRMLDMARREPVAIERNGRAVAVVVAIENYEQWEALEDAYWAARAKEGEASGLLSPEKAQKALAAIEKRHAAKGR